MFTVSALSGLNEQILEEMHMHVRGNAILPEKMVSRGWLHRTYCGLKTTKITNFPYFMVKCAFGQANNDGNVRCGENYT